MKKVGEIPMRFYQLAAVCALFICSLSGLSFSQPLEEKPPPVIEPPTENSAPPLFQRLTGLRADQGSIYASLSARLVLLGDKAIPFLEEKIRQQDLKSQWLARALQARILYPQPYLDYQAALEQRYNELLRAGAIVEMLDSKRIKKLNAPLKGLDTPDVLPFLIESVLWKQKPHPEIAIIALGLSGNQKAVEPMELYIRSNANDAFSVNVVRALMKLGDKNVPRLVVEVLKKSDSTNVQSRLLMLLQETRDISVIPDLQAWGRTVAKQSLQDDLTRTIHAIQRKPDSGFRVRPPDDF